MFTISKEFKFEAAHRLYLYDGKCARIHGHSYRVLVTVCREKNPMLLDSDNMVTDFASLNGFKEELDKTFDHRVILSASDPLINTLSKSGDEDILNSIVILNSSPTAELLAKYIHDILRKCLDDEHLQHIQIVQVVIGETCTSEASYIPKRGELK